MATLTKGIMRSIKIDEEVYWVLYDLKTNKQLNEHRTVTMSEIIKELLPSD